MYDLVAALKDLDRRRTNNFISVAALRTKPALFAGVGLLSAGLFANLVSGGSAPLSSVRTASTSSDAMTNEKANKAKPKLVVFDLDFTLWPQHVDSTVDPPLRKDKHGNVFDSYGQAIKPFPEVPALLEHLRAEGYQIAAASRTDAPPVANQLIKLLDWDRFFDYREIYPGRKTRHFEQFRQASGHEFSDMIFFDDEMRNIRDISGLGVTAIFVNSEGMTQRLFEEGVAEWRKKNARL